MPIYLDHAATTRIWPEVIAGLAADQEQTYANPSSVHRLGRSAEKHLEESLIRIGRTLSCHPGEILLTSGGSESINLAIKGFIQANPRLPARIISSRGEHAATSASLAYLQQQGVAIDELPLTSAGTVCLNTLAEALSRPAALISLIHVSNETGAINDADEIVRLRNKLCPSAAIHLDSVQAFGRLPVNFRQSGIELLSGSGHKIGAPKGVGWLLTREGIRLAPQIHGGGQQRGLRSGTENPPFAAALARALELSLADLAGQNRQVSILREVLLSGLTAAAIDYTILSPAEGVPNILMVAFAGLRGETMLHALGDKGIFVSTGAACSAKNKTANPVLLAMRVRADLAESAIRISLSAQNTIEEMHETARSIAGICRWLIRVK